jgi:hypothetical protein
VHSRISSIEARPGCESAEYISKLQAPSSHFEDHFKKMIILKKNHFDKNDLACKKMIFLKNKILPVMSAACLHNMLQRCIHLEFAIELVSLLVTLFDFLDISFFCPMSWKNRCLYAAII